MDDVWHEIASWGSFREVSALLGAPVPEHYIRLYLARSLHRLWEQRKRLSVGDVVWVGLNETCVWHKGVLHRRGGGDKGCAAKEGEPDDANLMWVVRRAGGEGDSFEHFDYIYDPLSVPASLQIMGKVRVTCARRTGAPRPP